jgi:hypothetical protein
MADRVDPTEAADRHEPTDPTDRAEPTDPMLSTDPADPIDRTDPVLAIDRNESSDHNERWSMSHIVAPHPPRHAGHRSGLRPRWMVRLPPGGEGRAPTLARSRLVLAVKLLVRRLA